MAASKIAGVAGAIVTAGILAAAVLGGQTPAPAPVALAPEMAPTVEPVRAWPSAAWGALPFEERHRRAQQCRGRASCLLAGLDLDAGAAQITDHGPGEPERP